MICAKDVCWLHCTSFLRAENTIDHQTSLEAKDCTVIAYPVFFRQLLYPVAALMDWDVAVTAEDNHILVFIVTTVTNYALGIFLSSESPGV